MAEQAAVLDISDKLIDRLEKADESLGKLIEKTDDLTSSFNKLTSDSLSNFAAVIDGIVDKIGTLQRAQVGDLGLNSTEEKAESAIDAINELFTVAESNGDTSLLGFNKEFQLIAKLKAELKELIAIRDKGYDDRDGDIIELDADTQQQLVDRIDTLKQQIKVQEESTRNRLDDYSKLKQANLEEMTNEVNNFEKKTKQIEAVEQKSYEDMRKWREKNIINEPSREELYAAEIKAAADADKAYQESSEAYAKQVDEKKKYIDELNKYALEADDKREKEQYELWLRKAMRRQEEERKQAEQTQRMAEVRGKAILEMRKDERESYEGAMLFSKKFANSIATQREAINRLKAAREKLNRTSLGDKEYEQRVKALTEEINRQQREINRLLGKNAELKSSQDSLVQAANRLKTVFASVFGIEAIRRYINELMSVRGELELQQRSLQAILQDKGEANKLWNQTMKLAVRSPFQIKELVTYTKQLAAYRVETEKLHDTTKMLADISAGLGVDMSRLILAYGQVKAANYLRGTELRQFSEAGINILDELAKHFSALEDTTVSVGEVFERVSKRMVSFEDVNIVLKKVTSETGIFYKMQEKQAETLRGQISNLKDSIQLMLNDIGKANDGVLKGSIAVVRTIVESWEQVATVLKSVIALLAIVKLQSILASEKMILMAIDMKVLTSEIPKTLTLAEGFKTIMRKIGTTARSSLATLLRFTTANPVFMALAASLALVVKTAGDLFSYRSDIKDIDKKYQQLTKSVKALSVSFEESFNAGLLESSRNELKKLIDLANQEYKLNIGIDGIDEMDIKDVEQQFINTRESIFDAHEFSKSLEKELAKMDIGIVSLFSGSGRNPMEQLKEFGDVAEKTFQRLRTETKDVALAIQDAGITLTSEQKRALIDISSPMGTEESKLSYIKRIQKAYAVLADVIEQSGASVKSLDKYMLESQQTIIDYKNIFSKLQDEIKWWWTEEQKERYLKFAVDQMALEQELDDAETEILYWAANKTFKVNITATYDKKDDKKVFAEWQESYNDMVKALSGFQKVTNPETTRDAVISDLKQIFNDNTTLLKQIEKAGEDATKKGGAYEKEDVEAIRKKTEDAKRILEWFGVEVDKSTKGVAKTQKDWVNEVIKSVRDAHKEYVSLINDLDATSSKSLALYRTVDTFNEAVSHVPQFSDIDLGKLQFETEDGAIDALELLKKRLPAAAAESRLAIEKAIGDIRGEVTISEAKDKKDELAREIEQMFTGYELNIEMGKLNVPSDWAEDLFGIQTFDLSEVREKISNEIKDIEANGGEKESLKMLKGYLDKVDKMEADAQKARIKKYLAYARDAVGERARIKLEEIKKLQEIELAFGEESTPIKQAAIQAVRDESYQQIQKQQWEDFQKTDVFVNLFDDLDNASSVLIDHAIDKLEEFRDQWKDMPHEEMKSIIQKINDLRDQLYKDAKPSKVIKSLKEERKTDKRSDEEIARDNIAQTEKIENAKEEIALLEQARELIHEGNDAELIALSLSSGRVELYGETVDSLNSQIAAQNKVVAAAQQQISKNDSILRINKKTKEEYAKQAEYIKDGQQMANDLYDAFVELADVLGGSDSPAAIFADMGMSMANTILDTFALRAQLKSATVEANTFAAAMNSAMGVVGWIVMGVQLISAGFKAVFAIHDNSLQKNIDTIGDSVSNLDAKLAKIEEALDTVFSTNALATYTAEASKNIDSQISAYESMIALESQKKKVDEAQMKEWEEAIEDLKERRKELYEEGFSTATAGILDDALSAAESFVDAWYEAFKETGDGLSGLEGEFDEMLLNLLKRQAAMQIVGSYMEQFKNALKQYIDPEHGDTEITAEEAKKWAAEVRDKFPEISEALEGFFSAMDGAIGATGGLSDLSKGIQGVTETTAQALEALLNSMRFYVADSNLRIQNIEALLTGRNATSNPMLNELKQHTALLTSIKDMFSSVIGSGNGSHAGAYLKVLM